MFITSVATVKLSGLLLATSVATVKLPGLLLATCVATVKLPGLLLTTAVAGNKPFRGAVATAAAMPTQAFPCL